MTSVGNDAILFPMFILPRRTLQTMLDALGSTLSVEQAEGLANRLNHPGADRLAAMWELILLWALSRVGELTHEQPLSSRKRPDVSFTGKDLRFIADIRTISDSGLHRENDVQAIWNEMMRLARKAGLEGNHFGLQVAGSPTNWSGDKVVLALPAPSGRSAFIVDNIKPFVRRARDARTALREVVVADGCRLTLTYSPGQRYARLIYPTYTIPKSLVRNPLGRALEDKIEQLRGVSEERLRGVIVCDGGCQLMSSPEGIASRGFYSRKEVVDSFLHGTTSIDFVLLLSASSKARGSLTPIPQLNSELVFSTRKDNTSRLASSTEKSLAETLDAALSLLPALTLDSLNASIRCLLETSPSMLGGMVYTHNMAKISSRALMGLLSGELSLEKFRREYGWTDDSEHPSGNPFAFASKSGKLIKSVTIEPDQQRDDDWLVIEFGEPDAAVAPFVAVRK